MECTRLTVENPPNNRILWKTPANGRAALGHACPAGGRLRNARPACAAPGAILEPGDQPGVLMSVPTFTMPRVVAKTYPVGSCDGSCLGR